MAERLEGFDVARLWDGDLGGLDATRLAHAQARAEDLPLDDGEADFVQSTSFLEHVDDVEGVVAELARVIKPGGWTWHLVDGLDHRIYADPSLPMLGFLSEPADLALVHGCNRLRPLEYAAVFGRHGFEAITASPSLHIEVGDDGGAGFVEPWRSMPADVLAHRSAVLSFRRR